MYLVVDGDVPVTYSTDNCLFAIKDLVSHPSLYVIYMIQIHDYVRSTFLGMTSSYCLHSAYEIKVF